MKEDLLFNQCFFLATTTAAPARATIPNVIAIPPKPVSALSSLSAPLSEELLEALSDALPVPEALPLPEGVVEAF